MNTTDINLLNEYAATIAEFLRRAGIAKRYPDEYAAAGRGELIN